MEMNQQNKIIFLIGRDNWQKDDALNHNLTSYLQQSGFEIRWEDPAGNLLYKKNKIEHKIKGLPSFIKKMNLRLIQVFYGLFHWSYFSYLSDRKSLSVDLRIRKLRKSISKLDTHKDIIILSRSAGGRYASCIADEYNIAHIICLSYPFKHPNEGVEPNRFIHLKHLKTPMLIIQGEQDEYGGIEVKDTYSFSPAIELFFVNTNHDFTLSKLDWDRVISKIDEILLAPKLI
jgi:hypothetical protein